MIKEPTVDSSHKFSRRDLLKFVGASGAAAALATLEKTVPKGSPKEIEMEKAPVITERLRQGEKELPLWFIGAWGDKGDNFIVSAAVVGEPVYKGKEAGRDIDELLYSKDASLPTVEIIVPVAFQNPNNGKFYHLNLSLGNRDIVAKTGMINLKDGQFLEGYPSGEGYNLYRGDTANYMVSKQELFGRIKEGEQIAFSLATSREALYGYLPPQAMEEIPDRVGKSEYFQKLEHEGVGNNSAVIEAMRNGRDLPTVTIYSSQFFMKE